MISKNIKDKIRENRLNIIIFIVYSSISFAMIFFHEQWRDEAQSWILAKNLSVVGLIRHLKYEGHFLLWYLIIMPFAKIGAPYQIQNIISWFFTVLAGGIFLKKAPFSKCKKILLLFSFPMLYLYPIVARCYCLIPLAIVLISIFYKDRVTRPIRYILSVVLLANTHVIMLGMVGFLLLEFYIQAITKKNERSKQINQKIFFSFLLASICLAITAFPLLGCITANNDVGHFSIRWQYLLYAILIEPLVMIQNLFVMFSNSYFILSIIVIFAMYLVYYEIKYYRIEALKIWIILFWQYLIYSFLYGMSTQRAATAIWIVIFFICNREKKPKEIKKFEYRLKNIAIIGLMVLNIINGLIFIKLDLSYNYSSAKETAEYIEENLEKDSIILVGNQVEFCTSIIPYTDKVKFYYIQREDYFSYVILDNINRLDLEMEDFDKTIEKFKNQKNIYYIYTPYKVEISTDKPVVEQLENNGTFIKIFESKTPFVSFEKYIIYKINIKE